MWANVTDFLRRSSVAEADGSVRAALLSCSRSPQYPSVSAASSLSARPDFAARWMLRWKNNNKKKHKK